MKNKVCQFRIFNDKNILMKMRKNMNNLIIFNWKEPLFLFIYGDSDICVSPSRFLFLNNELIINNVISILP
jgi:hypothetical protein